MKDLTPAPSSPEFNGKVLGQHDNTGEKPFLKPDSLKSRSFNFD